MGASEERRSSSLFSDGLSVDERANSSLRKWAASSDAPAALGLLLVALLLQRGAFSGRPAAAAAAHDCGRPHRRGITASVVVDFNALFDVDAAPDAAPTTAAAAPAPAPATPSALAAPIDRAAFRMVRESMVERGLGGEDDLF